MREEKKIFLFLYNKKKTEFSLPEKKKTRVLLFWGNLTKHKAIIFKER